LGDRSSRLWEQSTLAKGRSSSTSMAWGVHSSQLRFEVCKVVNIKYILPRHCIRREESRENAKKT
jgi:hypothetical protein